MRMKSRYGGAALCAAGAFMACGSDGSGPAPGGTGGTTAGGSGGASGASGSGASGGSSGRGGSAGTGGSSGSATGGSSGSSTGGSSGGGGAPDCASGPPTGALAGSCDTRTVDGNSLGQCREWFGTSGPNLQTSCNGLGGVFTSTARCAPDERVARCVLDPVLGLNAVYNYYSSRYTETSARSHCGGLGGCVLAAESLRVERAGAGSGQIQIVPPGVTCGGTRENPAEEPCAHSFPAGEVVTLTAAPDAMSRFAGWTGGGCGVDATCATTLTAPATIIANFAPRTMQTPFAWSFGGLAANADGVGRVAIGASGDLYFAAAFETSAAFDGRTLTAALRDVLIARLNPVTSTVTWFHQFGGSEYDNPGEIVLDRTGRVVATVSLWRSVTVGGQNFTFDQPSTVVIKLEAADGAFSWVRPITASTSLQLGRLAVDPNNDLFAAGTISNANGYSNVVVKKLSGTDGSEIWSKEFGGAESDALQDLAVDATGDVYLVGEYQQPINFGGSPLPATTPRNAFAAKLRGADGSHVWSVRRHEGGFLGGVVVNSAGAVFTAAQAGASGMAARLSPDDGTEFWSRAIGISPTIDVSAEGNPIVASQLRTTFDPGDGTLVGRGRHDIMVTELAADTGLHLSSVRLGGAGFDSFAGVAAVGPGDFYVSGSFEGSLELVGRTLTTAGNGDGFIARVQP
jgi:hypothetical protein